MCGVDDLYVAARRVLLDALTALGPHMEAVTLVGAQALYLHTGDTDLAVPAYTTDADLILDPAVLGQIPPLERALNDAGFVGPQGSAVGVWQRRAGGVLVDVDLMVPTTVSPGKGRRAARLAGHSGRAARKVSGLEGALVDRRQMVLGSLEPNRDERTVEVGVAGPGALLVAKLFKIAERRGTARSNDKDALDVFRLLRAVGTEELADALATVRGDPRSREVADEGFRLLGELFGDTSAEGVGMVVRATDLLMDEMEIRVSCTHLVHALTEAFDC